VRRTLNKRVTYLFGSPAKLYESHPELTTLIPPELYERGRRLAARLAQHESPVVLLQGDLNTGQHPGRRSREAAWSQLTPPRSSTTSVGVVTNPLQFRSDASRPSRMYWS
jgi:hypothetical protein